MANSKTRTPFILGFDGTELNSSTANHLLAMDPAGVVLFRRNIQSERQVIKLLNDLQELLGDIILSIDHEGGIVHRFPPEFPVPPSPRALRYCNKNDLLHQASRYQSELLSYLGFNLNFAPVLDLNLDSENQVIGTRAYSSDPREAAQYGNNCIQKHDAMGVGTTAKHFPTHGRTAIDSHTATGSVFHDGQEMLEEDLYPFKEAIQVGVPAIMTAHLTYPYLDEKYPATLSRKILNNLLRKAMGFEGLVISDCLEMDGISKNYNLETILEKGLKAGVDLFISSFSLKKERAFQKALCDAYRDISQQLNDLIFSSSERLSHFLNKYPPLARKADAFPDENANIELHQQTLEERSRADLPTGYENLYLVELVNREYDGINADAGLSTLIRIIADNCKSVVHTGVIYQCDAERLKAIIKICNRENLTCTLLSSNGFINPGYPDFVKLLKNSDSSLHIALLDQRDLSGECTIEWATRGCNAATGRMLAQQLNRLISP